jgi:hypothetical protein
MYHLLNTDGSNEMMDNICTDFIYPLPTNIEDCDDWKSVTELLENSRTRYPQIQFHVSVSDYYLLTTSPSAFSNLTNHLDLLQPSSVIVIVSQDINPGILKHVLAPYAARMSVSISFPSNNLYIGRTLVNQGIIELVDLVFTVLPQGWESSRYVIELSQGGVPAEKLVIGIPSILPSTNQFCNNDLTDWHPSRISNDQIIWRNVNKINEEFQMFMGNQTTDLVLGSSVRNVLVFDQELENPSNPICFWHKARFLRSVATPVANLTVATETELVELSHWESEADLSGRLRATLIFDTANEFEFFFSYFGITDAATFLASPIEHVILGYDKEGQVFDIRQPSCVEELVPIEMLDDIIKRYAIETVVKNYVENGTNIPNILIFPDAFESCYPTFISWVPIASDNFSSGNSNFTSPIDRIPGFNCNYSGFTFQSPRKIGDKWLKIILATEPPFTATDVVTATAETTLQPQTTSAATLPASTSTSILPSTSTVRTDSATTTTTETPTTNKALEEIVTLIHRFVLNKRKNKARRTSRRPEHHQGKKKYFNSPVSFYSFFKI